MYSTRSLTQERRFDDVTVPKLGSLERLLSHVAHAQSDNPVDTPIIAPLEQPTDEVAASKRKRLKRPLHALDPLHALRKHTAGTLSRFPRPGTPVR